jgi:hypothetical protein
MTLSFLQDRRDRTSHLTSAVQEVIRIALHEVGHALTYLVHHGRFRYVSIVPDVNNTTVPRLGSSNRDGYGIGSASRHRHD